MTGTTVLTIDLDAIVRNWRRLREHAHPAETAPVVKADAYGLGAPAVARALAAAGARVFFVAHASEGAELRRYLPKAEVRVLNGYGPFAPSDLEAWGLVPILSTPGDIEKAKVHAAASGRPLRAAIHVDTGMNRLGLSPREWRDASGDLRAIDIIEVMSHLACPEEPDHPMNERQRTLFEEITAWTGAKRSLAASSGIFLGKPYLLDLVRPGAALYGVNPVPGRTNPMEPVVSIMAPILQLRSIDTPSTVGYGATHSLTLGSKIATIAMGYADGFRRAHQGRSHVLIRGRPAPVVGRVSMDLVTVDVTEFPEGAAVVGALAEIVGPGRTVDDLASEIGTIGYEVLTSLGRRFDRRYVGGTA